MHPEFVFFFATMICWLTSEYSLSDGCLQSVICRFCLRRTHWLLFSSLRNWRVKKQHVQLLRYHSSKTETKTWFIILCIAFKVFLFICFSSIVWSCGRSVCSPFPSWHSSDICRLMKTWRRSSSASPLSPRHSIDVKLIRLYACVRQHFDFKSVSKGKPAKASKEDKSDTEMPSPTGNCLIMNEVDNKRCWSVVLACVEVQKSQGSTCKCTPNSRRR